MKKKIAVVALFVLLCLMFVSCDSSPKEIREATINEEGKLVITYTDGTQNVLGVVVGANGKDGADGEKGEKGDTGVVGVKGAQGIPGKAGKEIADISVTPEGNLLVSYDDSTEDTVELIGKLYLFGGFCGDSAAWAVYNGGILYLGGTGTVEYTAGNAPWSALIPMLAGCYVDTSQGLTLGSETLAGIDPGIIYYPGSQTETYVWVDMTVSANLYDAPSTAGAPVATLPLGTKLQVLGTEGDFYLVAYENGQMYIERQYIADNCESVVYDEITQEVTVTNEKGANLRSFPDATEASEHNKVEFAEKGTILHCVGISKNKRWLKISYEGQILYCLASLTDITTEA